MKIADYEGYEIYLPTSGGKAGKGKAKTCSLQVRKNNLIVKQFRFNLADKQDRSAAIGEAKKFIANNKMTERTP